jgi:hypothetical protein
MAEMSPAPSMLRKLLLFGGQSGYATSSQVLFSLSGLVTTAAVTRNATIEFAAAIFAIYALESVAVSAMRGFLVQAPLLRHDSGSLCQGDVTWATRAVVLGAAFWLVPTATLAWFQGLPQAWVLAALLWTLGLVISDVVRLQAVVFGSARRSLGPTVAHTVAVAVLSISIGEYDIRLFLVGAGVASLLLAVALRRDLLLSSRRDQDCAFWKREQPFAFAQSVETSGYAVILSGTAIAIANISAPSAVAMQVAGSAVVVPVLMILNAAGVVFIRRVVERQQQALSDVLPIVMWTLAAVVGMGCALLVVPLADELLFTFFGQGWALAQGIVPWMGLQAVCFTASYYVLVHYRVFVRSSVVTRAYVASVLVAQGPVLIMVILQGIDGLPWGFALSCAFQLVFWIPTMTTWSKRYER